MEDLKNGKVAGKDEVIGEMIKGGDDMVVDWTCRLCSMAFESGIVPEDEICGDSSMLKGYRRRD